MIGSLEQESNAQRSAARAESGGKKADEYGAMSRGKEKEGDWERGRKGNGKETRGRYRRGEEEENEDDDDDEEEEEKGGEGEGEEASDENRQETKIKKAPAEVDVVPDVRRMKNLWNESQQIAPCGFLICS